MGADLCTFLQFLHRLRVMYKPVHVALMGLYRHLQVGKMLPYFIRESQHALSASVNRAGTGYYLNIPMEQTGVTRHHPLGYLPVLPLTQRCELATIALCVFPDFAQQTVYLLAQSCKVSHILKQRVDPHITSIIRQPSGAVASIMGDIEWSVAVGRRWQIERKWDGIGIIDTA